MNRPHPQITASLRTCLSSLLNGGAATIDDVNAMLDFIDARHRTLEMDNARLIEDAQTTSITVYDESVSAKQWKRMLRDYERAMKKATP